MFWAFDKELCINCEAVVFHTEITVTQYKHTYIKVCGRVVWLAIAYFLPIVIMVAQLLRRAGSRDSVPGSWEEGIRTYTCAAALCFTHFPS